MLHHLWEIAKRLCALVIVIGVALFFYLLFVLRAPIVISFVEAATAYFLQLLPSICWPHIGPEPLVEAEVPLCIPSWIHELLIENHAGIFVVGVIFGTISAVFCWKTVWVWFIPARMKSWFEFR